MYLDRLAQAPLGLIMAAGGSSRRLDGQTVFLTILAVLAALVLIRALYEPGVLEVTHRVLTAPRPSGSGLTVRVAVFSDLHADSLRIKPEQVVRALAENPVDLILFLGDLASGDRKADLAARFLEPVSRAARTSGIPFMAVTGNHDGPAARQVLTDLGIDLVDNRQIRLTTGSGVNLLITGLADFKTGHPDLELVSAASSPDAVAASGQLNPIRIVLAHNPDMILHLPEAGGDFFLSGHFHGGQIYAPLQLEFRLMRSEQLPRRGIWRGAFSLNGFSGYITRGLGCVWLPLRFLSKPELSILELRCDAPKS